MAPCRDLSVKVSQLYSMYCNMSPLPTTADIKNEQIMATTGSVLCCYPDGECLNSDVIITADHLIDCVRVICNNENCLGGEFMHRQCFDAWEQGILLKAIGGYGRSARQWSERQRNQNLWTKKGFELVQKVCHCKCGSGNIRKDLDWLSPTNNCSITKNGHIGNGQQLSSQQRFVNSTVISEEEDKKKRKKRNRNHAHQQQQKLPLSVLSANNVSNAVNVQQQSLQMQQQQHATPNNGKQMNDGNGSNVTTANTNVGVIGSGLQQNNNIANDSINHQLNSQQQQQQQQIIITSTLNNLLNSSNSLNTASNNILGLDLRTRASSLSSGAEGGSGTTSPSTSQTSGELSVWKPIQQQTHQQQTHQQQQLHPIPLLTQRYIGSENVSLSPQQQHIQQHNCFFQQQQNMNGLSKSMYNGYLTPANNANTTASLLIKSQQDQQKQQTIINQQLVVYDQQHLMQQQKNKEVELYSERVR